MALPMKTNCDTTILHYFPSAIQMQARPKLNMRKEILASYCLGSEDMQEVMINGGSLKYPFKVRTGSKTFKLH